MTTTQNFLCHVSWHKPLWHKMAKWHKFRIISTLNWSKNWVFVHFFAYKISTELETITFLILLWFNWLKIILFYKKHYYICEINLLKCVLLYIILCHLCCHVSWHKTYSVSCVMTKKILTKCKGLGLTKKINITAIFHGKQFFFLSRLHQRYILQEYVS